MRLAAFLFKKLISGIEHESDPDENGEYTYSQVTTVICGVLLLIFLIKAI